MRDVLLAQLKSLAAQVAAMEHTIRVWMPDPMDEPTTNVACPHLETEEVGTFGDIDKRCVACGAVV